MSRRKNIAIRYIALAAIAAAILAVVPFLGSRSVSFADISHIFSGGAKTVGERIFWDIRMPRVLLAFIAGATLSVCGLSFQSIFRNPLADPFLLGVSGGAALGAVVAIRFGLTFSFLGVIGPQLFAFAGALATIFIVYGIAKSHKGFTVATMLLTGVAVSFFFSALIMMVQYIADFSNSFAMVRWMMGSMSIVGFKPVIQISVLSAAGVFVVFLKRSEMNLMMAGDELAAGRGVDVEKTRRAIFIAVSLATGAVVAICGPIGFVGLIIPHIMRIIFGADHFDLAPACLIGGGAFLVLCDTAARLVILPAEIPVGIVTAMLGGPFFIWLLFRNPN
ncbi:MAG: iron ABC transporter permease [bacterium]